MSLTGSSIQEDALRKYVGLLNQREKSQFTAATVNDVLVDAQRLEETQRSSSKTRRISQHIDPVVKFLRRYAQIVDVLIQYDPHPSALAWGLLRFLLQVAGSFTTYFSKVLSMMERIGDELSIYSCYEQMFADSERFKLALTHVYLDILSFLCKAKSIFQTKGLKTFRKLVWKPFESEFEEDLLNLSRHKSLLDSETTLAHRHIVHIERMRSVMEWLLPVDVWSDFQRELARKTDGTGQWLIQNTSYQEWRERSGPESILWITGRPGTGKTVLSATIIQDLSQRVADNEGYEVCYFFFDRNHGMETTLLALFASLIAQLARRMRTAPPVLLEAFEIAVKYGQSRISNRDDPPRILRSLAMNFPRLYLVLDGLDESGEESKMLEAVIQLVHDLPSVNVVCLSRDTADTRKHLGRHKVINLDTALVKSDINKYLLAELSTMSDLFGSDDLQDLLYHRLSQGAEGSFLWAHLMMQTLRAAPSPFELVARMDKLPQGLPEIYETILEGLRKESDAIQRLAEKLFLWVACTTYPLSWAELESALALDPEDEELNPAKKPFKAVVLRLCNPLIEYQVEQDIFRPIHLSVCEYLLSGTVVSNSAIDSPKKRSFSTPKPTADCYVAVACIRYLSMPCVADNVVLDPQRFPLTSYATLQLCHHVLQSPADPTLQQRLAQFMASHERRRVWQARSLLTQLAAFPLQDLIKQQRSLKFWMTKPGQESMTEYSFNILEEFFGILLFLTDDQQTLSKSIDRDLPRIGHFEKMMVVRDLARAYTTTGRLDAGDGWLKNALAEQRQRFGEQAIQIVWILNSLGVIYDQQKRFELSAEIQQEALRIQKSQLPSDSLETVWTINELGRVYRHLERLDDAESMHIQALGTLKSVLPEDDMQVVWTTNTLARTYRFQGRLDEAMSSHRRALVCQQRSMGPQHAHTLWTMTDIGRCLRDQGAIQAAYEQQLAALEGRRKLLGENHFDTLWSLNDVGLLLSSLGRGNEARECHEQAFQGQKALLGESHPVTLWTRDTLNEITTKE